MRKYRNKYRVESARLPLWDYANPGYYFVTICAKDRVPYFGQIDQGRMHLSPSGEIVVEEWQKTATIRQNVELDAWVVMPNHIHGIVIITDTADGRNHPAQQADGRRWKPGVLGSIINQFKGACTRAIRQTYNPVFSWQSRFYDHVIRDERSLDRIRSYIDGNPLKWELDDLYIVIPPEGVMASQGVETPRRGVSTRGANEGR